MNSSRKTDGIGFVLSCLILLVSVILCHGGSVADRVRMTCIKVAGTENTFRMENKADTVFAVILRQLPLDQVPVALQNSYNPEKEEIVLSRDQWRFNKERSSITIMRRVENALYRVVAEVRVTKPWLFFLPADVDQKTLMVWINDQRIKPGIDYRFNPADSTLAITRAELCLPQTHYRIVWRWKSFIGKGMMSNYTSRLSGL
ncbi:MAG: hypothetical protein JW795_01370 [Chitinivibrionales bacterium]|nr:hypothetical protein [Chitinivibrionales bacterium]